MSIYIEDAILSLRPKAEFVLADGELEWRDEVQTEPTQSEIDAEVIRLQAEYDSQEYARKRSAEYPSIDELVVALWEGVVEERMASVTKLEIKRQAVKAKHPK